MSIWRLVFPWGRCEWQLETKSMKRCIEKKTEGDEKA